MHFQKRKVLAAPAALALVLGITVAYGGGSTEAIAATSDAPAWTIQPGGKLGFAVVNNGSETVSGQFADWSGDIRFDPSNPATAAIKIDVDLASASVGDAFRDKLLTEDEFFNLPIQAVATFESSSVEALPDGRYLARGTLSLKGVSKPQELEFRLTGDGDSRHVEGSATVDRVGYNIGMGQYGGGLDKAVTVDFAFDATR